jgi:hypothetical protein
MFPPVNEGLAHPLRLPYPILDLNSKSEQTCVEFDVVQAAFKPQSTSSQAPLGCFAKWRPITTTRRVPLHRVQSRRIRSLPTCGVCLGPLPIHGVTPPPQMETRVRIVVDLDQLKARGYYLAQRPSWANVFAL